MLGSVESAALPPIRKPSKLYLGVLLCLVILFYLLLAAALLATAYAFYRLILFVPNYLQHVRGGGAIKLLIAAFIGIIVFGAAILRGILVKIGGDPFGIKLSRDEHPEVFALSDEVAAKVSASPIDDVFLTPEDDLGVWEEAALYKPPGLGKRKIVRGMAALNYLTLEQLRCILAHEYGHFSNRDTFFGRFIHRVRGSYGALLTELSGSKIQYLNPLYWIIRLYFFIYDLISSSFSRRQEFAADRFAVEAYGGPVFRHGLVAAHLEGIFFNQVGMRQAFELAKEGKAFDNVYRFVSAAREDLEKNRLSEKQAALEKLLAHKTGARDSHPCLKDRLEAQGEPASFDALAPPPRAVADPGPARETLPGEPSAAEALFGKQAGALQSELSRMLAAKFQHFIRAAMEQE